MTQGSASYLDLDITQEVEDDDDDADTRSAKGSMPSAVSCNPASESNVSVSEL
jgi:hypothetical protein